MFPKTNNYNILILVIFTSVYKHDFQNVSDPTITDSTIEQEKTYSCYIKAVTFSPTIFKYLYLGTIYFFN